MNITCPNCNERLDLTHAVEDECGRAFMALLARLPGAVGRELILYLNLFKPRTQALRWSRALALGEDVKQLTNELPEAVAVQGLRETVEAMRSKRQSPEWKPLTNHNYLKRVLETVQARGVASAMPAKPEPAAGAQSRTQQALAALDQYQAPAEIPAEFSAPIVDALREWFVLGLEGRPGADVVADLAHTWVMKVWRARAWEDPSLKFNLRYLQHALKKVEDESKRWPQPGDLLAHVQGVRSRV